MNNIVLIDPSLQDNKGNLSTNLGDIIIYDSIQKNLEFVFSRSNLIRISSHDFFSDASFNAVKNADYIFFGGTNALSSNIIEYNQWLLSKKKYYYLFPKVKNVILIGVGWWQYQAKPTIVTKYFYNSVLNKKIYHSVRDNYTKNKLKEVGIKNVINTGCPTIWNLDGFNGNRNRLSTKNCVFTFTDYNRHIEYDSKLLRIILDFFPDSIYFFPQGKNDLDYIKTLPIFQQNSNRIALLSYDFCELNQFQEEDVVFIGTRLHGGVKFMQMGKESLIVGVDNRAIEMAKDFSLPVVKRDDFISIDKWLKGESIFKPISIPLNQIDKWKEQFV